VLGGVGLPSAGLNVNVWFPVWVEKRPEKRSSG
jgi:hypothetical protein